MRNTGVMMRRYRRVGCGCIFAILFVAVLIGLLASIFGTLAEYDRISNETSSDGSSTSYYQGDSDSSSTGGENANVVVYDDDFLSLYGETAREFAERVQNDGITTEVGDDGSVTVTYEDAEYLEAITEASSNENRIISRIEKFSDDVSTYTSINRDRIDIHAPREMFDNPRFKAQIKQLVIACAYDQLLHNLGNPVYTVEVTCYDAETYEMVNEIQTYTNE